MRSPACRRRRRSRSSSSRGTSAAAPRPSRRLPTPVDIVVGHEDRARRSVHRAHRPRATRSLGLQGRGFGHGRGMSQWGARGAASQGLTAAQILDFYYPGTTAASVGNPAGARAPHLDGQQPDGRRGRGRAHPHRRHLHRSPRPGERHVVAGEPHWTARHGRSRATTPTRRASPGGGRLSTTCTGFTKAKDLTFVGDGSVANSVLTLRTPSGNRAVPRRAARHTGHPARLRGQRHHHRHGQRPGDGQLPALGRPGRDARFLGAGGRQGPVRRRPLLHGGPARQRRRLRHLRHHGLPGLPGAHQLQPRAPELRRCGRSDVRAGPQVRHRDRRDGVQLHQRRPDRRVDPALPGRQGRPLRRRLRRRTRHLVLPLAAGHGDRKGVAGHRYVPARWP